jgi:catechol 2,3-dioxygenase-like lactoylglutathione lyase family enzyme
MAVITRLVGTTIDCPDPFALREFYLRLTGWQKVWENDEFTSMSADGSMSGVLGFQRVADYQAPGWPGQERPQQFHLDFVVDDLDAGQQAAVSIGARLAATQPEPESWRVLLDPAGHPFCLVTEFEG